MNKQNIRPFVRQIALEVGVYRILRTLDTTFFHRQSLQAELAFHRQFIQPEISISDRSSPSQSSGLWRDLCEKYFKPAQVTK